MHCLNCFRPAQEGDYFCVGCGNKLATPLCVHVISRAGHELTFCPKCGERLVGRVTAITLDRITLKLQESLMG